MEARLLSAVGKLAGLAGLALGVFLLVFRDLLSKNFLPFAGLTQAQSFAVLVAAMIFTFRISGIGMMAWLIGRSSQRTTPQQLRTLAGLFIAVPIFAVSIAGIVLLQESATKSQAEQAQQQEKLHQVQLANYKIVSRLTNDHV